MGGFAMALYVPLTLYINRRFLPKFAKPGGGVHHDDDTRVAGLCRVRRSCIFWEIGRLIGG